MKTTLCAKWIIPGDALGMAAPRFERAFTISGSIQKATLRITAAGVYEAEINGKRVGDYILAPGFTDYTKRLQVQTYDVTQLLAENNRISVLVGRGWYRSNLDGWYQCELQREQAKKPAALIAVLTVLHTDGTTTTISTDRQWCVSESPVRFSGLYDGEVYDATFQPTSVCQAEEWDGPDETLIEQEGPAVKEMDSLHPARIFRTPKGELVLDFGQNMTGCVQTTLTAKAGEVVDLSFAEVLDSDGNFYTENYRSAKCRYRYICTDGEQTYKPKLSFWGFRYIRVNAFPNGPEQAAAHHFRAIVLHSEMRRTGYLHCSEPLLNQLFDNVVWGQKSNFLDVPTDCPQRDERMGWTGDAQMFCRTACLNFDTEQFFSKWLHDLAVGQREDGCVGYVVPDILKNGKTSAAWGDAATVCPWEVYLAFGNLELLRRQYHSMKQWVYYIQTHTGTPDLWTGETHFGDWLGLDAPAGSYKGKSREDLIASAYYAHSLQLVIKAGTALGEDVSQEAALLARAKEAFRLKFPLYHTQTECVLAAHFNLCADPQATADQLAQMIRQDGVQMKTGFVGTPYLLHVLTDYGYQELAYSLLLRREYPSWLYSVTRGATTIWEHWDGLMPDGSFWSPDMNSFNHYAYGAVLDWVYTKAAGLQTVENKPGYQEVIVAPHPDARLDWLEARLETRHGILLSRWKKQENMWRFDIQTPVPATVKLGKQTHICPAGSHVFFCALNEI